MYKPSSGRLNYAKGKIYVIWAHYNYFFESNEFHTADTLIALDAIDGKN